MALVRELLSYLALVSAVVVALPAVLVMRPLVSALFTSAVTAGLRAQETYQAAVQLCSPNQGSVGWLTLAAILLADYALLRIWGSVERL